MGTTEEELLDNAIVAINKIEKTTMNRKPDSFKRLAVF